MLLVQVVPMPGCGREMVIAQIQLPVGSSEQFREELKELVRRYSQTPDKPEPRGGSRR